MMTPYLITDCGSTTTKALLIGGETPATARLLGCAESPTTVEAPHADVTIGVLASLAALEDVVGRRLRTKDGSRPDPEVAHFLSTSSAGGGLQMLVAGVVRHLSAASAERAALAAGAIVQAVFSADDGLPAHERIAAIRRLRPDMVVLAGGTDGGTITHVAEMAEALAAAAPAPRLGPLGPNGSAVPLAAIAPLPVIYAGNPEAWPAAARALHARCAPRQVANVRPTLERETTDPARDAIHELFMEHVMARAPSYDRLCGWVAAPVLPTPSAVGVTIRAAATHLQSDVLAVDIGGATTDVFTVSAGTYHRSVGANFGMSYSATHVLAAAGPEAVSRWLPFPMDSGALTDRVANKMVRPTTVPATMQDLWIEHALARAALRLALAHHRQIATSPSTHPRRRTLGDTLAGASRNTPAADTFGLIIGSGGVLSHAPRREQAALMLLDAFEPWGVTRLAVDSVFMLPHLGVLSGLCPDAAEHAFWRDCLIPLGTAVAPRGPAPSLSGRVGADRIRIHPGTLLRLPCPPGAVARAELQPSRGADLGAGPGRPVHVELHGGEVGLLFDCRGRPLPQPEAPRAVAAWMTAAGAFP